MQIKQATHSPTEVTLSVILGGDELTPIKEQVLGRFQADISLPGFRKGKAPLALVEKSLDQSRLQSAFLEEAINQSYPQAIGKEGLRPVDRPDITIKKFVPFTTLEYDAKVAVVTGIKIPDLSRTKVKKASVVITDKDIKDVLSSLRQRLAEKQPVERASKSGDQVWIDFKGIDSKGNPVNGADGKDYPLLLGSNTFIPGFEDNLIGVKANESKTFTVTFPSDYGVKALSGKQVTFEVKVHRVEELAEPKLDDDFAAKAGPFKSLKDLKEDIKRQLMHERQHQANLDYESALVREVTAKTKFVIPEVLVLDQVERLMQELKQNLAYRGQTLKEFLEGQAMSEEVYRHKVLAPQANERVRASLVLAEIAERQNLHVTPEELEIRIQLLKSQYTDAAMRAELDKPENRRDIAARMLSEKTVAYIAKSAK
jgi:trigger factor